jgi:hypothetical protein
LGWISAAAFGITLAFLTVSRLSDEAIGVLAGAVIGVGAAIPTSLLIVSVSRRQEQRHYPVQQQPAGSYPPVVVVAPPGAQTAWPGLGPDLLQRRQPRRFTVVGGDGL